MLLGKITIRDFFPSLLLVAPINLKGSVFWRLLCIARRKRTSKKNGRKGIAGGKQFLTENELVFRCVFFLRRLLAP